MNSTARTAVRLLIATPIAAGAIAFGAGTDVAQAQPAGPVIIVATPSDPQGPGDIAQPTPAPQPDPPAPQPNGPGDIAQPTPDPEPNPHGPGDIAQPTPDPEPNPHGPGDLTAPEPQDDPTDDPTDDPADDTFDGVELDTDNGDGIEVSNSGGLHPIVTEDVQLPNRIDAGAALAPASDDEQGMALSWFLVTGGVVTAVGAVAARRQLSRRTR